MLLATRGGLAPSASELLRSLGVKSAVLIGGENSLSSNVEADLKSAGVESVERVAGNDRVETSVKVKEKYFAGVTTALYASGWSFPMHLLHLVLELCLAHRCFLQEMRIR